MIKGPSHRVDELFFSNKALRTVLRNFLLVFLCQFLIFCFLTAQAQPKVSLTAPSSTPVGVITGVSSSTTVTHGTTSSVISPNGTTSAINSTNGATATNAFVNGVNPNSNSTTTITSITQSTPLLLLNWNTLNIPSGNTLQFIQPSASSLAINRVASSATVINGGLTANGQVWILNPNGVLIGSGGSVNVGSFLATTNSLVQTDTDLLANNNTLTGTFSGYGFLTQNSAGTNNIPLCNSTLCGSSFGPSISQTYSTYSFKTSSNASSIVSNDGTISVSNGGYVALLGTAVRNTGTVNAPSGVIGLGAGNSFTLDFMGDKLLSFEVTSPVLNAPSDSIGSLIYNSGTLSANGGIIALSAQAANSVVSEVINTSGLIQATRASVDDLGNIFLNGGSSGLVNVGGTLDVSSETSSGVRGGNVLITGQSINVNPSAVISAFGDKGGGNIYIGSNFTNGDQGVLNGTIASGSPTALVTLSNDSALNASALTIGDGGVISVKSDSTNSLGSTITQGSMYAYGGLSSGNGGLINTSGYTLTVNSGSVSASATNGIAGVWQLNSINPLLIDSSSSSKSTNTSFISSATLSNTLATVTDVLINSSGQLTIGGAISSGQNNNAGDLTLSSVGNLSINAPITSAGAITLSSNGTVDLNSNISMLNSDFDIAINGSLMGSGNLQIGGSSLKLTSNAPLTGSLPVYSGIISGTGSLELKEGGGQQLSGANTYTGGTLVGGLLQAGNSSAFGTGDVTVKNGGSLDLNGFEINNNLFLAGEGVNNGGALMNSSTSNAAVKGDVILNDDTFITSVGGLSFLGSINGPYDLTAHIKSFLSFSSVGEEEPLTNIIITGTGPITVEYTITTYGEQTFNGRSLQLTDSNIEVLQSLSGQISDLYETPPSPLILSLIHI